MFQSVLVNRPYTKEDVSLLFSQKLNKLGDRVANKHKYGVIGFPVNKLSFIKIKNLYPYIDQVNNVSLLNQLVNCLNN